MSSETITKNDLKTILNEVLPSCAIDYVVDQGSSGNWYYRKWNSGRLEQWCRYNPGTYTCGTTRGSLYSGGNLSPSFPIAFNEIHSFTGSVSLSTDGYVVWLQFNGYSPTGLSCRIVSSGSISANSNYQIQLYAEGTWK